MNKVNVAGSVQPGPQHLAGGELVSEQLLLFSVEEGELCTKSDLIEYLIQTHYF